jgi:hypothetical protein
MITGATFLFFARKHSEAQLSRTATPANDRKKRSVFLRRREATTFQKCLAVHMYYAAMPRKLG